MPTRWCAGPSFCRTGWENPRKFWSSPAATRLRKRKQAGADFVGGEEMVEKINKENWTDFDALIATPDVMKSVGRLGKVLGPKGLMPNPKTGTVTFDVAKAVQEVKAGKVEFRTDKTALVHVPVGKISFTPDKLVENATVVISSVIKAKPTVAKGKYIKGCYLSSTMGPGISIDTAQVEAAAKAIRKRPERDGALAPSGRVTRTPGPRTGCSTKDRGIESWRLAERKKSSRWRSWERS